MSKGESYANSISIFSSALRLQQYRAVHRGAAINVITNDG
jgi:hypothetical protein